MGQYYKIVNLDKKEVVNVWELGGVAKLIEWCNNIDAGVFPYLLWKSDDAGGGDHPEPEKTEYLGRWAEDRIVLIGDYDSSKLYTKASEEYNDISKGLRDEFFSFIGERESHGKNTLKPDFIFSIKRD